MKGSSKLAVLYPECTLEPPGELYKLLMPKRHLQRFWLNRPGVRSDLRAFRNSPVQFSRSVVSDSLRPLDCSTPGFPVHHQLPELAQTRIHGIGDALQPSHPLLSPSPAFNKLPGPL